MQVPPPPAPPPPGPRLTAVATGPGSFASVLDLRAGPGTACRGAPACWGDLHLDQVVAALTAGRDAEDLAPRFYATLRDPDAIAYRHEAFRDLEGAPLREAVARFGLRMRRMRAWIGHATTVRQPLQRQRWYLDAVAAYVEAVIGLAGDLDGAHPASRALRGVHGYLRAVVADPAFVALRDDAAARLAQVAAVRYRLHLHGDVIAVEPAPGPVGPTGAGPAAGPGAEPAAGPAAGPAGDAADADYGAAVARTFAKFAQAPGKDKRATFAEPLEMNHVEAAVLEMVAKTHPAVFADLAAFVDRHPLFVDPVLERFDREVHFYLAYLDLIRPLQAAGLPFCYPTVSAHDKATRSVGGFDLALALVREPAAIVPNDVELAGDERVLVVTGANQGGKTTFARTFGQLHHLAGLGCPIPGRAATVFLADAVLTHFEREEDLRTRRGKLEEELVRLRALLQRATPDSVVVMNEAFTSTAAADARFLGGRILDRLFELDALGVYVTFVDELASAGPKTVSLVAAVDPDDPARRTFRIERRPADGRAHALSIARAHRLTRDDLRERLGP
jgi:DNA mismatch repair protein MutS